MAVNRGLHKGSPMNPGWIEISKSEQPKSEQQKPEIISNLLGHDSRDSNSKTVTARITARHKKMQ